MKGTLPVILVVCLLFSACTSGPVEKQVAPEFEDTPDPTETHKPTNTLIPTPTLVPTRTSTNTPILTPAPALTYDHYKELMSNAENLYYSADFEGAIKSFSDILNNYSIDKQEISTDLIGAIYAWRADAYDNIGDRETALSDYLKAYELFIRDAILFNNICWDYALIGEPNKGLPFCDIAVGNDLIQFYKLPNDSRGLTHALLGNYELAIEDYQIVVDSLEGEEDGFFRAIYHSRVEWLEALKNGDNPFTKEVIEGLSQPDYLMIAGYFIESKSYEAAIKVLSMAIEYDPENTEAYNQRGALYMDQEFEFDLAIKDFNKTLELNPQHIGALINRGNACDYKGEPDLAIEDYNSALELNPQQAEAFHNRGLAYNTKGDYDQALQDFNRAIELNPDYKFAYNSRCLLFRNNGELEKALEDCNKGIEIDPDFAMVLTNRGYVYHLLGDHENAISDLTRSIELNPQYGPTFVIRGFSYDAIGETQSAISDYEQALAVGLDPEGQASVEEILDNLTRDKIATPESTALQKIYSDDFSNPSAYLNPIEFDGVRTSFSKGGYRIEVMKENWVFREPAASELSDVVVEVDADNLGIDENYYGLMCRAVDGKNHYILGISSLGYFSINKITDNEWQELISKKSEAINTGKSSNHLRIICEGENLSLLVNDVLLTTVTDEEFSEGLVGPFAGSFELTPVDLLFDNFVVYQISP